MSVVCYLVPSYASFLLLKFDILYACVYACVHARVYACMHAYTHVRVRAYTRMCMWTYEHVRVHTRMVRKLCVYEYAYWAKTSLYLAIR